MIRLDLREAQSSLRLFTEGCHVVLEGQLVQGVFKVQVLYFTTMLVGILDELSELRYDVA